jgi:hypothetical protein
VSYYAEDLFWCEGEQGFVCENCWEYLPRVRVNPEDEDEDGELPPRGLSLADVIRARELLAVDLINPHSIR